MLGSASFRNLARARIATMTTHTITHCRLADGQSLHLITDLADTMVGATIRQNVIWEPAETTLLQALATPGDTVADIGAHVGYFTVLLSKCAGPTGRVVAFEPELGNFELLKADCIINGCTNVVLERSAVADRCGRAELYLASGNHGDHRLHATPGRSSQEVAVIRLDDYWRDRPLDIIKVDAQGAEPAILRGGSETIRANANRLLCLLELSPGLYRAAGQELDTFLELLTKLDARTFSVAPAALGRLEPLDGTALSALWQDLLVSEYDDANASLLLVFSDVARERLRSRISGVGRTQSATGTV
jgi:FkbM family methyltransferase